MTVPDRLWGTNDSLDDVFTNKHLVCLVDAEGHRVCHLGHFLLLPKLTHHVLQVNHTCTQTTQV